ncbi:MAG: DUF805 domain-containing protein [Lactobacillus sp.]|jgi:uncharacterized membrane protein YhaH (DUF805 family)|nr:DUF805 domain-containing protein [Lactobacillus sp.]MCI2032687.1 DUF805 domain-containing protein [Lactobacillus sp.]
MVKSTPEEQSLTNNQYYRATGGTALKAWIMNTLNFTGRSSRAEFWWMALFFMVVEVANYYVVMSFAPPFSFRSIISLLEIPWIALVVRRYRDAGIPVSLAIFQIGYDFLFHYVPVSASEPVLLVLGWADILCWLVGLILALLPSRKLASVVEQDNP